MALVAALVVFAVGFVCGRVTRWFALPAAVFALALYLLGHVVTPAPVADVVGSVLNGFYYGNELLFLSGLLFGVAGDDRGR